MRSGELVAHLPTLLGEVVAPAYLPSLIEAKAEAEHGGAHTVDGAVAARDVEALHTVLDEAQAGSRLADAGSGFDALHDLVVRARLGWLGRRRPAGPDQERLHTLQVRLRGQG